MDQIRDVYNMVHACEIANEAERDVAIRRASGFNELFEAAVKKECAVDTGNGSGSGLGRAQDQHSGSGSKKGKEKQSFGPEVKDLQELVKKLVKAGGGMAASKWICGVDLIEDDLTHLIRGADCQGQDSHTGYDYPLPSDSLQSGSAALHPDKLEDPNKTQLRFDKPSASILSIPELPPKEYPTYSGILVAPDDSEPDPVIEAFTKRAKAEAIMAGKLLIQDEVDEPVSYHDYGEEFIPQSSLIPKRPWLMPRRPIILPPTNIPPTDITRDMATKSDADDQLPDIPSSESVDMPYQIDVSDSDNIPESSTSSEISFPVSDDHGSDVMDVVRSDEHDIPMSAADTDSGSDVVFPESPIATRSIGVSGAMVGIERDPNTGQFTAASFANFPDELLD